MSGPTEQYQAGLEVGYGYALADVETWLTRKHLDGQPCDLPALADELGAARREHRATGRQLGAS